MTISVVIPLYNKVGMVRRAIESVIAQTHLPNEIIVVNDGSTDGSDSIVEALGHPLVRLIHQPNAGVSAARNIGIELATGDWIAFLDADDVWGAKHLSLIANAIDNTESSNVSIIATIQNDKIYKDYLIKVESVTDYAKMLLNNGPLFNSSTVCINRKYLSIMSGFDTNIQAGEDMLMWFKMSNVKPIYIINEITVFIDAPGPNERKLRTKASEDPLKDSLVAYCSKYSCPFLAKQMFLSFWFKVRARTFYDKNYRYESLIFISKSIISYPFNYKAIFLFVHVILSFIGLQKITLYFKK